MTSPLDEYTIDALANLIRARILTEQEVADQIVRRRPRGEDRVKLVNAVLSVMGQAVTGPIRSAFREVEGLAPLPEDARPGNLGLMGFPAD